MNLLRRLELNGFKSFAQKTILEFPEGITAIVGPNGSGKSNVIDAIRWLLGERETKNLRGTKVEDLIFAGTAKRGRLGQAQASLHFDNHNKFFPIDFAEVSVSRQVNRDGVSQYFLNKSEVRLKDVVDFFARARLGTKGLVVIGQGNSDLFVQANPLSRREMIEEMLGLREYQIKRADAERRLRNSQINLEKAQALIEEILPHLRSLKRQTNRWEKRGVLDKELKDLEHTFFGYQFKKLREKMSAVEKDIKSHESELGLLEKERNQAQAHLKEIEASQPKEREEINEIKKQTQSLLENKSRLQKEIGRLEAQIEMAERAPEAVSSETPNLLPLIKKVKHGLEAHLEEEDVEELRRVIEILLEEIDEALADMPKESEEKKTAHTFRAQFSEISEELSDLEGKIRELKEKENSLEKNQEEFYRAFRAAAAELETAKNKIEKWENVNRERSFEKERLHMRLEELERQVVQLDRKPSEFLEFQVTRELSESDLSGLERQILKYRGDLASIGEIDETLIKEARETEERYEFLEHQSDDLEHAKTDLEALIRDLSEKIKTEFGSALLRINEEFNKFFNLMFNGGHAKLKMTKRKEPALAAMNISEEGNLEEGETKKDDREAEEGIEIELSLPRKRLNSLEMLSGGERSLVGIAALFALISVSPPPFLVLDEVDAALDDRNALRFSEILKEFSKKVQFVIVTHNRVVMEAANVLYGVTMNDDGTSKVLSLKLE
ncbi:MAG: AAA family ATPase [Patescibacteria group bacterium]